MPERSTAAPGTVLLRPARATDAERLTELVRTSPAYAGEYRRIVAGVTVTAEQLARDVAIVAERAGAVLGFYILTLNDGPAAGSPDAARPPELDLLFVDPAAQGAGVGRQLMAHLAVRDHPFLRTSDHPDLRT